MPDLPGLTDADLLTGHDPAERIVGIHAEGSSAVRLYFRSADGEVTTETAAVHPFFFVTDAALLTGFPRSRFRVQRLAGDGAYRDVVVFPDRGAQFDALRHVERASGTEAARPADVYQVGGLEQQYLMQTGRTLFTGMAFDELRRLQLDIEVVAHGGFPQAEVAEHRIVLVALSDSTGWQHLVGAPGMAEAEILRETVRIVTERDPDVIEGHNLYGFDLPYLAARCQRHGVALALGRDGSAPRTFPSSIRFAERQIDYEAVEIAGRHVVDTLFLVMSFDVFTRDLPNYTLKGVARYFGFAPEGRTYVPGDQIAAVWESDPARIMDYALDDVTETERIARHLSGSTFYLTQMVPMPYGVIARTGPAAKIEALFVRAYLRARHSLPRAQWGSQHVGGYTDVFVTGVVGPIVYADVESLYPSIMLQYGVQPASDALGLFPRLLRTLTDLRLDTKAAARATADAHERGELDARQTAYKNIINCFDEATEVLTVGGVKRIADVQVGDEVYALDPASLVVEIKPVVRTFRAPHTGPMVRMKSRHVDFLVTPEHRMLTSRVLRGTHLPYAWEPAADLLRDKVRRKLPPHPRLPGRLQQPTVRLDALCERLGIDGYVVADGRIRSTEKNAKAHPVEYATADWLAFLGWFIAEEHTYRSVPKRYENGNHRGVYHMACIGQKRADGRAEIAGLLDRMGIAYSTSVNGLSFCSRVVCDVLDAECGKGSAEKRIPAWVFALPPDDLEHLFQALMSGDGDRHGMRYTTQSEALARDVVRLCHHVGRFAFVMSHDGAYRIAVNSSRGASPVLKDTHRSAVPFEGDVYCVEVADHHTVLAGRNGKLNWCGQSFYGNLGFQFALFNDFAEADRVAATGQQLLRQIMAAVREAGGLVVEVDTDGVLFVPPPHVLGEAQERAFVAALSAGMPHGIRIGFDGRYRTMLSYKKKNYALLGYDGTLAFKGSSLVSRSSERFGRAFVRDATRLLLDVADRGPEAVADLHRLYLDARERIVAHDWSVAEGGGVESFQRVETLKMALEDYEREVAEDGRTRSAAYEVAAREAARTGRPIRRGSAM